MNSFALVGLVSAVFSTALGGFSLIKSSKKVHYIWAFFLFSVALWGFGIYKFASTLNIESAVLWWRVAEIGVILIPVLLTHFVTEFLELPGKKDIYVIYAITAIFLYLDIFTDYFFGPLRFVFGQFYYITPTVAYTLFLSMFFGLVIYTVVKLWQAYKTRQGSIKAQIKYLILAFTIGFTGGSTSFLPVYYIDVIPFYNITIFLASLILTYAIFKHHLMDIKVFAAYIFIAILNLFAFIYIFFSESLKEYIIFTIFFLGTLFISFLLYKSFNKEIKRREELQALSDKLSLANIELKKLDKIKSEFLSFASHQIKAPMTVVKGYASMIYDGSFGKLPEKVKNTAIQIQEMTDRLINLVNDFLNLRKIEEGEMEYQFKEINIIELIKNIVEELKVIAEKKKLNLSFEPFFNAKELKIKADEQKLRQVIQNLVENAIKYTDKGFVRVELKEDKDSVLISVTDSGRGISKDLLPNLFQQFSRASSVKKIQGTGLGLYIAKEIINAHHGKIWAESEGKGARFCVRLSKHQN